MKKTVIFLGKRKAPGSPLAQWPGAELWGTTHSNQKYAKPYGTVDDWSSWWDLHLIHRTPFYPGIKAKRPSTYRWYQTLPGPCDPNYRPLFLFELDPTIPAGVLFPVQDVLQAFPATDHWYTCQVDYMMAYALLKGYEHIILHGHGTKEDAVHFTSHRGPIHWVTLARARGVQVTVIPPSWYLPPSKPYALEAGGWSPGRHW